MPRTAQLSLDDWIPGRRPPRARTTDPLSSHAAADRMEESGKMGRQLGDVLVLVRAFPGRTSKELGELGVLDRYTVARRLPELGRLGLVRREGTPGEEIRWWPKERA